MDSLSLDRVKQLTPAKRRLLQRRLEARAGAAVPAIPRSPLRGSTDRFPCSFAQQRLWFLHQLDPTGWSNNSFWALKLTGELDTAALARVLAEVVRRHEILRTSFTLEDEPVQVIAARTEASLPLVDLGRLAGAARLAEELGRLAREQARHVFDLSRAPLLRVSVVRCGAAEHVLLLTLHHIVTDDWSMGVLVRELVALYEAFRQGLPSPLPELALQYADFAHWQRQRFAGDALESELRYWRGQLADLPPPLELPADRTRPAVPSLRGGSRGLRLASSLLAQLQECGRRQGATLFMTLLAAFVSLLARYTGRSDLTTGSPVAGRNQLQTEPLIGCFVNTLVLRARLAGDPAFAAILRQVKEVALGALAHQELPFDKLIAELQPERDLARNPVYQVMFSLHNVRAEAIEVPGWRVESLVLGSPAAKLDLILNLQESSGGLGATVEYSRDLFEAATIERLLRHFRVLLEGSATDPSLPLSCLPLLSAAERQALLREWNDSAEAGGEWPCVDRMLAAAAAAGPQAPAVIWGEERFTYGEIAGKARRLAHTLRRRGVGPDVRVLLCADREPALLVAIWGILAAGGAYVPLDPAHPRERQALILEDVLRAAGPRLVLASAAYAERFRGVEPSLQVVLLDDDFALDGGDGDLPPVATPESLAYVLYTSGSTGRPKGVAVHHRGLANYLSWCRHAYRTGEGNGAPVHSSLSFDLTVTALLAPLVAGKPVTLLPEGEDAVAPLAAALGRHAGYSLVKLTPAHLRALAHALGPGEIAGAAHSLIVGGEALLAEDFALWRRHAPATRIVNEYGPTEAVVGCAVYEVPAEAAAGPVPIGRPIWNSRLHVLDRCLLPVPVGVAGELSVGGAGVARGYDGRPDLTAERFVPGDGGERLYRTGDVVRRLADGRLEYLGRTDDQVKIHGYRIEPGEIEAQLAGHPAVKEAAVVARRGGDGAAQLAAFVVPAGGEAGAGPSGEALRSFLAARLPEYMLPAVYRTVAALPLTANGKIDRRALAGTALEAPPARSREEEPDAAGNPVEELLAGIWKEVLRCQRVGRHDNFFELGGDSILSLQVASRARQAGVRITSRQLFAYPTIAGLAGVATATAAAKSERAAAADVPLTPVQRWFFERCLDHPEHYNLALLLQVGAIDDSGRRPPAATLRRAFAHLLAHHDALRFRFERAGDGSGWRQAAAATVPAVFPVVDLSRLLRERRKEAISELAAAAQQGFSLAVGPLFRGALFVAGGDEADRLLLVAHHLVVDGVSWRVLLEDLETACRQLDRGEAVSLPPVPASFARWAAHLGELVRSGGLDGERGFWLELLRGAPPPLPQDLDAGPNTAASARSVVVSLDAEETGSLLRRVPRAYRTQINDVLLTALAEAFAGWTGERRLLLELEGHGREELFAELDLSRTVGWFTSQFPVLLDLAIDAAPGDSLKAVKEQLRSIPRRGVGWGLLRSLGGGESGEDLWRLPRPEVVFNYLGQLDQSVAAGRLFRPADESAGPERHPGQERPALFEIAGGIGGGRLHMRFVYSKNRHRRPTVQRLAEGFLAALRSLVAHCSQPGVTGRTPSDFPLARLDQAALDRLMAAAGQVEDLYPATPMQEGMLFHALQAPASGVYVVQIGITLNVRLDVAAFERAWARLIGRHPALRTSFLWSGVETSLQVVHESVTPEWLHLDWRALSAGEQARRLAAHLAADRSRGFDLRRPPLLRFCLLRLADESYRFLWSVHHTVIDGWSSPVVLRELFTLYSAGVAGTEPRLGDARPLRDYVAWLLQQDMAAAEGFWRGALAGFSAPTRLALDRGTAAAAESGAFGSRRELLSAAQSDGLRALARRHQLTLNTLLQGCWALLLGCYSGDEDILFGSVTAGRAAPVPGIEQMVGLFINTVPVRARLEPAAELRGWLRALQALQVEARQHEHAPLSRVRAWSDVGPGLPLFESILVFESYPVDEAAAREAGEAFRAGAVTTREQTNYPVTIVVAPAARLSLEISHDEERIGGLAAARMLRHLTSALSGLLAGLERPLAAVPLLSPEERQQIVDEWNDGAAAGQPDRLLHELFAEQAAATPEAPAVKCGERTLGYGELDAWAGALAQWLRSLGVGPGSRAGLCLGRSPAVVAAMLGVLKAGAAYVPLDPEWPLERLAAVAADSAMEILLTEGSLARELAGRVAARVVSFEASPPQPVHGATPGPWPGELDGCAYVIYTSGSTGVAKGVEVTHRGVVNFVRGVLARVPLGRGDRILLFAPLSFDASVVQIFPALASGACVVVHANPRELGSGDILNLCQREELTVLDLPAAVWRQWVQDVAALRQPLPPRLRTFLTGGESVPAALFRTWAALTDRPVRFLSSYGPTETTVTASVFTAGNAGPPPAWQQVPIGRPLPNVRLHLLDRWLRVVPVGVPGQLFIGGPGLARGYLGRADLTAEAFLPDALSGAGGGAPGGRLYRTGDLARRLPDGSLEFLGRADRQVKVRGFRIEPAEIESALSLHPAVHAAVVVLREDHPGDKRLVAYFVREPAAAPPTVGDLRGFLAATLTPAMVPSTFIPVAAIPVLASGKVDRSALPAPEESRPDLGGEHTAPRTLEEETLARIWKQVLRIERVGVHDNFFELGGDSILSIQIIARANEAGLRLTPKQLFDHQTVAELARAARTAPGLQAEQGPVSGPAPLLPIQRWLFAQGLRRPEHFNNAVLLDVRRPLGPAILARMAAVIVAHHDALRLRFVRHGLEWEQSGAAREDGALWAQIDLGHLPASRRGEALLAAAIQTQSAGFDLARGPLTRFVLCDLGEGRRRLLWVVHHLAVDGVSWRILLDDLEALHRQLSAGDPPRLPAKTSSFQLWAERLAAHARSEALRAERDFWLASAAVECPPLPLDFPDGRRGNSLASMRSVTASLSAEETQGLLQEIPAAYRTQIQDALLSALGAAFAEWTGAPVLRVDLEGHGREPLFDDVDLSRTVGWFTTQFPVVLSPGSTADCAEQLLAVKEQLRRIPGRGVGYGLLRYSSAADGLAHELDRAPEAEVSFNYLGQFAAGGAPEESAFAATDEPTGPDMGPGERRPHLLEVSGVVSGGRLLLRFNYSAGAHRRATIERLAETMCGTLRRLVESCRSGGAAAYSASDFPLAALDSESFRELSVLLDDDE